jgi:hypothetical protein
LALAAGAAQAAQLIVRTEGGAVLLELELDDDPHWAVLWNHSVTGMLVEDDYRYEDGQMLLSQSHTPDFAAGLGYIAGRGWLESDDAHGYWIRDIDEPVPGNCYWLRVGSAAVDHRIATGGAVYSLSALAPRARVQVCVEEAHP